MIGIPCIHSVQTPTHNAVSSAYHTMLISHLHMITVLLLFGHRHCSTTGIRRFGGLGRCIWHGHIFKGILRHGADGE